HLIVPASGKSGCAPFTDTINGQDRRFVERARKKRAGRVTLMMVGKNEPGFARSAKMLSKRAAHMELVFEPNGHRQAETFEAVRSVRQIGLQQTIKLGQGLVIKCNVT